MTYISKVAAGLALAVSLWGQRVSSWTADAPQFKMHMIGQAHIDPVWLWPWPEGLSVVHSTFRSALDRMKENPDFAFTASSAQFYAWVAENDPAMLKEIRQRVDEGRWSPVGGWWVEPDVNIPSGESMVRQGLYGQMTLQRLLGRRAKVAYNPDSFGHAGTLPQILKLQGMENYVFMRPMPNEKTLPASVFWWEAPDGSRVLTYRIPFSYNDTGPVRTRVERIVAQMKQEPVKSFMAFYGAGDHGGGATKINIQSIQEIRSQAGAPAVVYSTPDRYFAEIRSADASLPVVKGDLQHHSVGCYTADSELKKGNRAAEAALLTAEKLAAVGAVAWGAAYPKREFTSAWERVLFLQFHDSMAGTSLPEHSQTAREGHGYALDIAHQATYKALQKLAWQVPAEDPASQYVLVFNPHAWEITENVEYDLSRYSRMGGQTVVDEQGAALPFQWAAGTAEAGGRTRLIVRTSVPAFGYRQIRVRAAETAAAAAAKVRAEGNVLENEHLRVSFAIDGTMGIFDKDAGKDVFRGGQSGARAVVLKDLSDTWSHNVKAYTDEIGAFQNASAQVVENGPLRGRMRVRSAFGASTLTTDWLLYAGATTLEARVTLDWHEQQKMLKFSFPVDVEQPAPTYEVAYGHLAREANGDEDPGQRWLDVTGTRGGKAYGLAVINDAKYGYSVAGNDLRVSIVRGAAYAHHQPRVLDPKVEHIWQDQGIQTFRMLLAPHAGSWQESGIVRLAEQFAVPAPAIFQGIHGGSRPQLDSFLAVNAPNVVVSAVKQAEEGDDLILRCYETAGAAASASLDLRFAKRQWSGSFRPSEIKTLRLNTRTGAIREVNLLEE